MIPDHTGTPLSSLISLAGRTAVVTGGAKGIGQATVRRLAEAGANVIVGDLDRAGAEAAAQSVGGIATTLDVTDSASLGAAADLAVATYGRLDIWVNNAGVYPTTGPAIDVDRRVRRSDVGDQRTRHLCGRSRGSQTHDQRWRDREPCLNSWIPRRTRHQRVRRVETCGHRTHQELRHRVRAR